MDMIKVSLENCFGISMMNADIDFSQNNTVVIYAPNGTMKSSFAKTFCAIRDGKEPEEKVFGYKSKYKIVDGQGSTISKDSIMVVNPFEESPCDNQGLLMANTVLREKYLSIYSSIEERKEYLFSQIKGTLKYSPKSAFDLETNLLADYGCTKHELYTCLELIANQLNDEKMICKLDVDDLDYNLLFNEKIQAMITSENTAELLDKYVEKYNELVEKSLFMRKGIIDHNNYSKISLTLFENGFFAAENEIRLNAKDGSASVPIMSQKQLDDLIKNEKDQIFNSKDIKDLFEKINKIITKNKDTQAISLFLQKNPDVVIEYIDINLFKRKVWVKAFSGYEKYLNDLIDWYKTAKQDLAELRIQAKKETTEWNKALELFRERFSVPFHIEAANQDDVILNMDLPSFKYTFDNNGGKAEIQKEKLLAVLSTGERRAFYILNLIFQILVAQRENHEKIIIMDDISESFDYRNKYAIIEYINDISKYENSAGEQLFKVLLLTHNFDFYRTVASRITIRNNAYIAYLDKNEVKLSKGEYIKNVFGYFKSKLENDDKFIVASIPFVRNLIEYSENDSNQEYLVLTSVLHCKIDTKTITLKQIEDIYNQYWCKVKNVNFAKGRENQTIYDLVILEAQKIPSTEKIDIENKLILSMSIRLIAEEYMIDQIMTRIPDGLTIMNKIYSEKCQTAKLIQIYKQNKQFVDTSVIDKLELVAMLTTENIHINSFMFEPILDMSLKHLHTLYQKVCAM